MWCILMNWGSHRVKCDSCSQYVKCDTQSVIAISSLVSEIWLATEHRQSQLSSIKRNTWCKFVILIFIIYYELWFNKNKKNHVWSFFGYSFILNAMMELFSLFCLLQQQLSAYMAWVNSQLKKKPGTPLIEDLLNDMRDGVVFADVIEIVCKCETNEA